ncbi:MAG: hypothetical protein A2015_04265 [Spirochaetes bacterium GWF1_31_7]|nr:MAG: hypothetical protein A2Y30_17005 [Spirochaetes bacterium GWE1_32_154]OHD47398.1 MAG: hypothetical protein A2Y29_10015 [Spirochaetes bacterium GWE2_31_10]OHD52935.1 MAG: hypothetical protein A2015_04265 [Spirochaetes bacterium GWF1_31_7]OHD77745.1 MAG: hypothetical protein A2355_06855 [Spirochaetes bacterium RIFOXYB1_FULL_32_8]HBD93678.1 hypothetical protein [Spirochaetia bacterium]
MKIDIDFCSCILKKLKFIHTKPEQIEALFLNSHYKKLEKDQFIYMEGDTISSFYLLLSGKVEIFKNTDKYSNKIFGVLTRGDIFGVPELFLDEHSVNAKSITPVEYLCVDLSELLDNFSVYPGLIFDLLKQSSRMIAEMQRALCIESAEKKVVSYVYHLMTASGIKVDRGVYVKKNQSNERIASILNITRETLSRIFTDLKNRGIIETTRDSIVVLKPDELGDLLVSDQKLAGFYGSTE